MSGHPAVGVLVDFYHHWYNHDALDTLPDFAGLLYHVHYGRPIDRCVPGPEDAETLARLAAVLKQCPNAERISLECSWKPDFDAAVTAAVPYMDVFRQI